MASDVRDLVYRFLRLSYYDRINIAQTLGVFADEDTELSDTDKFKNIFQRIYDQGKIKNLLAEIRKVERN